MGLHPVWVLGPSCLISGWSPAAMAGFSRKKGASRSALPGCRGDTTIRGRRIKNLCGWNQHSTGTSLRRLAAIERNRMDEAVRNDEHVECWFRPHIILTRRPWIVVAALHTGTAAL